MTREEQELGEAEAKRANDIRAHFKADQPKKPIPPKNTTKVRSEKEK